MLDANGPKTIKQEIEEALGVDITITWVQDPLRVEKGEEGAGRDKRSIEHQRISGGVCPKCLKPLGNVWLDTDARIAPGCEGCKWTVEKHLYQFKLEDSQGIGAKDAGREESAKGGGMPPSLRKGLQLVIVFDLVLLVLALIAAITGIL